MHHTMRQFDKQGDKLFCPSKCHINSYLSLREYTPGLRVSIKDICLFSSFLLICCQDHFQISVFQSFFNLNGLATPAFKADDADPVSQAK